jgi:nicotinamidase-related amidase
MTKPVDVTLSMGDVEANPYPYPLPENKPCLIIIDMQRDFMEPGGFGESWGNDVSLVRTIIEPLQKLLATCRELGIPVVHTREAHSPDLSDCPAAKINRGNSALKIGDTGPMGRILVSDSAGNEIIPELAPIDGELELIKPGKGAFYNTSIEQHLVQLGCTHLIMTGVTTEVCVQTTMREANDRGYECLLVEDCTESYFPEFKRATIDMMTAQGGIVGWSTQSALLIETLEKTYG